MKCNDQNNDQKQIEVEQANKNKLPNQKQIEVEQANKNKFVNLDCKSKPKNILKLSLSQNSVN